MIIRLIVLFLLISTQCFGAINEKYSYKNFTNQSFTDVDASEFNDSEIVGSCFAQKEPKTTVFPKGITGTTFRSNNLDNIYLEDVPNDIELNTTSVYISKNNNHYIKNTHLYIKAYDDTYWIISKGLITSQIEKLNPDEEILE